MTKEPKKKQEPPLGLEMDFLEVLERFARTDPKEVAESVERLKQKKPPGDAEPPGGPERRSRVKPSSGRKRQPPDGA